MQTLEQQLKSDWNETISNLTPEEKEMLKNSTPQDWIKAISDLVKSPEFWASIAVAFAEGIIRGIDSYANEQF
jgi:hypothetical protein